MESSFMQSLNSIQQDGIKHNASSSVKLNASSNVIKQDEIKRNASPNVIKQDGIS
jgi:hypothetical protein